MDLITITIVDKNSSDTMSRTFSTENALNLLIAVEEFETECKYWRYMLVTPDDIDEYDSEVIAILEQLEVTN